MELQLGLGLPSADPISTGSKKLPHWLQSAEDSSKKKRIIEATSPEDSNELPRTLSLLVWDRIVSNHHDFDTCHTDTGRDGEEDEVLVGWPPLRHRKRGQHSRSSSQSGDKESKSSTSKYVKVKMEGVAIARKIDTSIYSSLSLLKHDLLTMFGVENLESYDLNYQDMRGHWQTADCKTDWKNFLKMVQRLKLVKRQYVEENVLICIL